MAEVVAKLSANASGIRRRVRHFQPDDAGGERRVKPRDRQRHGPRHDGGGETYGRPHD